MKFLKKVYERIKMDLTRLEVAIGKFGTDFGRFADQIRKFLAGLPVEDPAAQNRIDTVAAALESLDVQVKALDDLVPEQVDTPPVDPPVDPQP